MDSAEIDALFERTLEEGYDDEGPWEAVGRLRATGSREVFERAAVWCQSADPKKRARAADVICQLYRKRPGTTGAETQYLFREESYSLISNILKSEQDEHVIMAAVFALGHLYKVEAVPTILRYLAHFNEEVRFAVACALCHFPNETLSASGLLKLTCDPDDDVRDWAVFGLGVQGDADSPEIREALLRCLDNPNEDVREEAAVGLGRRQDPRVLPKLWSMLEETEIGVRPAEAATALLGLDKNPPEWVAEDYRTALRRKFNLRD